MGRKIKFVKSQGIGNDFIIIDDLLETIDLSKETLARLCNRHFGIGADGLILIRPSLSGDYFMRFYNSDGSEAEMCGNGVRCFARYLYDHKLTDRTEINIETKAGLKKVLLLLVDGQPSMVRVDMGEPSFNPLDLNVLIAEKDMIDYEIETEKGIVKTTCLSMGNPHCVLFTENVDDAPVRTLGPLIEHLPLFQKRTNVEFVQVLNPREIRLRVWERGAGETLACGTGAAAAAVAVMKGKHTDRKIGVKLPGGTLEIEWAPDNHVFMTGPAEEIFNGEFDLDVFGAETG